MNSVNVALSSAINPQNLLLLLGLSFFLGLAYEDLYGRSQLHHPGGVRTFPLLSMSGVCLFLLEPQYGLVFAAGLRISLVPIFLLIFLAIIGCIQPLWDFMSN